jgi:lysophospholipase L1-like esterase
MAMRTHPATLVPVLLACVPSFLGAADLKVACVGNSITAGMGVASNLNYPTKLDGILGSGYAVTNYGNSGKTMLRDVNDAYWKQPEFAKVFADKPDIIVIELGTNDSKNYIWPYNKQNFKRDYKAMIDTFRTISSKPSIWITLQPRANNISWGMPDTTIALRVNPLIREVALENATGLIDLRTGFNGHPEWYQSDSVHPNAAGANGMATIIGAVLKHAPLAILQDPYGGVQAPSGFGYQWYRNDTLLVGDTARILKSLVRRGSYKVSVKYEQNTESRLVTTSVVSTGVQVRSRSSIKVGVLMDGSLELRGADATGAVLRVRDARGNEVAPKNLPSGVYAWTIEVDGELLHGKVAVP